MKVINFFGGPGVGKSTAACDLFVAMKKTGYKVEYVDEYAKEKTYEKEFKKLDDQLYILAKQHRKLNKLHGQVDYVVTDSPLFLSAYYNSLKHEVNDGISYSMSTFTLMVQEIICKYDNIYVKISRNPAIEYQEFGRNQTLEEAKKIDYDLAQMLYLLNTSYSPKPNFPVYTIQQGTKTGTSILEMLTGDL